MIGDATYQFVIAYIKLLNRSFKNVKTYNTV